jgi:hypothetical protein
MLADGQANALAGLLFPAAPAPADLHQSYTAYARTAIRVIAKMAKRLAEPPGTPLGIPAGTS